MRLTATSLWAIAIAVGLGLLWKHQGAPSPVGKAPIAWPAEVALARVPGRPTLVTCVHPRCPCTRASLAQLSELLIRYPGRVNAYVVFEIPPGLTDDARERELWKTASKIPQVTPVVDVDGSIGRHFGAQTSGETFFYDANGSLRFSGGITAARGHVGDNDGSSAIEDLLNSVPPKTAKTHVFGCELW